MVVMKCSPLSDIMSKFMAKPSGGEQGGEEPVCGGGEGDAEQYQVN